MENREELALLEEYKANIALWIHDDTLRQQRTSNFLTTNTVLLVALSTLLNIKHDTISLAFTAVLISIFGLLISFIWLSILYRNAEYIKFRRFQLMHLENKMPVMSTFTNTYLALYKHKPIEYKDINQTFRIDKKGKQNSTFSEGKLPKLIIAFWAIVFMFGITVLLVQSCDSVTTWFSKQFADLGITYIQVISGL